ncbi:SulP family inorganic anion transporter [Clostridium tetanomorphum]|uniref:STAS domain-containing protein n=1 Tax=Clostridium tetanomorphum TaxID=1553 RepID=A0A923J161_CLOTT|nr:SulP family inorganic anion transporter [Clostridium tetanomorphum]MBC2396998.1 STAS domain-containing protein [Clostridium tetanomorphum]NRZ99160.1 SulP family sulfate permease [Clostridium tetanomorphum]
MFMPKLFSIAKEEGLEKGQLMKDFIAGIIVAIIALPLSVALAISSGVSPEKGLITAIIAGFFISLLGGSKVQIGGPTGAFVVIVYGIIQKYGIEGLTIATIMAGVFLIIFGLLKFGDLVKYIPYTITIGFTAGIAVVLFSTQIKDFLGLSINKVPSEFLPKWYSYITNLNTLSYSTVIIGLVSLLTIIYWPRINKTIPGSLVALIVATVAVKLLNLPVETIGSRFGQISSSIPKPVIPNMNMEVIKGLIGPAMTIAILAGIESLLSAVVADGMIRDKHDSNAELVAQGVANIVSALFGGIPATGAIARTAANVKNGGKTPIAGIIHAITLLFIMLIFMPYAKLIPMTTLGAILIVVSYNMSNWRTFKELLKAPRGEVAVLLTTFTLTVVFDLVVAIEIGMVLSMFLFMKKMCDHTKISPIISEKELDNKVLLYEIRGPFFFAVSQNLKDVLNEIKSETRVVILNMNKVPVMDASAYNTLNDIYSHCKKNNIKLIYSEVQEQPMRLIKRMSNFAKQEEKRFFSSLNEALSEARELISIKSMS